MERTRNFFSMSNIVLFNHELGKILILLIAWKVRNICYMKIIYVTSGENFQMQKQTAITKLKAQVL